MSLPSPVAAVPGLSAQAYARHALHAEDRVWVEKNCYVDVWIELLNVLELEPLALMPFTLAVDFEGDQWTFFKPSLDELRLLYGIDVQELNVWRPLLDHALEHLPRGRLISVEADAFWLPDTVATDYGQQHVKTTIVLNELDLAGQRLGYFHNAGYFALEGEDFRQLFRLDGREGAGRLPLYAEMIRTDRLLRRPDVELRRLALGLLRTHAARRPVDNPVHRFAQRLEAELPRLHEQGLAHYHLWAFSTVRQLGAAFELAAACLRWVDPSGGAAWTGAAEHFEQIANDNKALILKLARVVSARRSFDAAATLAPTVQAWSEGMRLLDEALAERSTEDA
ncbi:DUF1839 family protein [Piscinibacter sp. HJYY11]|uniref:DUF1839 family protein n=1 Tax=Piscinibacter sp. HJYY11 TaxID=2801333 RepID=UPI00191F9E7C|nr:DUF1839 family protein [Piscinibacter sp. HJYY11]MBL0730325.1 DUF1839 family protein [Piscinibacter sp. HJYY11]